METRARYLIVGLFTLAVILGGFGFVYWLHNSGGLSERTAYRIRFESAVPGIRPGSAVLFNGVRVGEVTDLRLSSTNPREVMATIVIERNTPVRSDTQVGVESQGLMAAPSVTLRGGNTDAAPLRSAPGEPGMLVADPAAGQDTMQAAREVLRHIDKVVVENAEPLRGTVANLKTFTDALARNSDRIDPLLDALERMTGTGTGAKAPPRVFDLTAPRLFPGLGKVPAGQLLVLDPTTVVALETQKILVTSAAGSIPIFQDTQWSDSIPKLVQARVIQSFENAQYRRVARPMDGFAADHQLMIDIRNFRVLNGSEPLATVEFGAKILGEGGRVVDGRVFHATAPAKITDAASAAAALDEAFGKAVVELVAWTVALI
jgi:phospholipid/cholesterol/gamma-HCH transport system substrate-binding protein